MTHVALKRHLYVHVLSRFLTKDDADVSTVEAVLHGFYTPLGEAAYGHLLLSSGAHWCGIPIHALSLRKPSEVPPPVAEVQPWGCMGEVPVCAEMPYLHGLSGRVLATNRPFVHTGMILDWRDGGFVREASQHKPLHLVGIGEDENLALLPNNYIIFYDPSTLDREPTATERYRRNVERWFPEQSP